ncbi:MAG: AmmeMemoRadiSam system protein B, partial [Kiritimatiellae bacterium]|nr:AmmeMemoRadiSam system protein B [Kiritimatiellia bacterium]
AMAPHAGYVYSAPVAAYTFKVLSTAEVDTVVIIGHDSHRNAVAFVSAADEFETPLGRIPVDREMVEKLLALDTGIREDRMMHARDHTVEVQLPFLQVLRKNWKIVPVMFGDPTPENCRIFADAIVSAAGSKRVLILASTDMSHYPPYDVACKIDRSTLKVLEELDVRKLFLHLEEQQEKAVRYNEQTAMCARGGVGVAILFAKAKGGNHVQILHYANSGDASVGSKDSVVGYGAAVIVKKP